MNRAQVKRQIQHLRQQLSAVNRASDSRLLRLAFLMIVLAIIVTFLYGKIAI